MHEIKISQLGEGLTEVRVVALLKNEGDLLQKDELLLEVETDKAVMEIETPHGGCLRKWLVQPGETIPVGTTVARVESLAHQNGNGANGNGANGNGANGNGANGNGANGAAPAQIELPKPAPKVRNRAVSPREKAALKNKEHDAPLDLSVRQARLGQLFSDSQNYISEASITVRVPWDELLPTCHELKDSLALNRRPSRPELIAWSVMRAMKDHARFLTINNGAQGYETQSEVCLGNAVGLPHDELGVASLPAASTLELSAFLDAMRRSIVDVQAGRSTPGRPQMLISYMAGHDIWTATPRVLFPAVATLFVGTPHDVPVKADDGGVRWRQFSNFVLTFDHRILNGVGAAAFMTSVAGYLANPVAT